MSAKRPDSDLPAPKAILFDWDGTLVDTHPALAAAMNVALEAFGKEPWSYEQWSTWLGRSARDAFPRVFGEDWEKARTIYLDAYGEQHLERLSPIDGAIDLLQSLSELPLYLGVVSNKSGPFLRKEVKHLQWGDYFAHLIGAGDSTRDKPAPDPVHDVLAYGDHSTGSDIWFVGDNDVDVLCGKSAECSTILIGHGYPDAEPDCRVEDLAAVLALVRETLERA